MDAIQTAAPFIMHFQLKSHNEYDLAFLIIRVVDEYSKTFNNNATGQSSRIAYPPCMSTVHTRQKRISHHDPPKHKQPMELINPVTQTIAIISSLASSISLGGQLLCEWPGDQLAVSQHDSMGPASCITSPPAIQRAYSTSQGGGVK